MGLVLASKEYSCPALHFPHAVSAHVRAYVLSTLTRVTEHTNIGMAAAVAVLAFITQLNSSEFKSV